MFLPKYLQDAIDIDPEANYQDLDGLMFFFDRGEDFFGPFHKKWLRETKRARREERPNPWVAVTRVDTIGMERLPGLQAADVLAWCVNRENTAEMGKPGRMHAHIIKQIVAGRWINFDEAMLRRHYTK